MRIRADILLWNNLREKLPALPALLEAGEVEVEAASEGQVPTGLLPFISADTSHTEILAQCWQYSHLVGKVWKIKRVASAN